MIIKKMSFKVISKKIYLVFLLNIISLNVNAAWIDNIQTVLTQPDGTTISAFLSGDEYYNFHHDSEYYTIIKDHVTGYWCWAISHDGGIISTGYPICTTPREFLNLAPRENISEEKYQNLRASFDFEFNVGGVLLPSIGEIRNIVIFIRFLGDVDFTYPLSFFEKMYNTQGINSESNIPISLYQYFWEVSYNQLQVYSSFFPEPVGDMIVSYQSEKEREYFMPFDSINNPIGFINASDEYNRRQKLFEDVIYAIRDQIPDNLIIDMNNDGYVDNISFIVKGEPIVGSQFLWPRYSRLNDRVVKINGKIVRDINVIIENSLFDYISGIYVGLLVHEFAHSLGLLDYYTLNDPIIPLSSWEVMSYPTRIPQSISSYLKMQYTDWMPDIPWIETSGTYNLYPLTIIDSSNTPRAYKIRSPYSVTEFFVIEYRSKLTGWIDRQIPIGFYFDAGLLVYRVDSSRNIKGNFSGGPYELYVYSPIEILNDGTILNDPTEAYFSLNVGRTAIHAGTNPEPLLQDNSQGGLNIVNIGYANDTISFDIIIPQVQPNQTVYVTNNENLIDDILYFGTIQAAIDFVFVNATIILFPETFSGEGNKNIVWRNKNITLIGMSQGDIKPIIDCEDELGFVFKDITIQNKISDIEIINATTALQITGNQGPCIENIIFKNNDIAIYINIETEEEYLITDCLFIGDILNDHSFHKSAIFAQNIPYLSVKNSVFKYNSGDSSSSLYFRGDKLILENNLFQENFSGSLGVNINIGGRYRYSKENFVYIINNKFINNKTFQHSNSYLSSTDITISIVEHFDNIFISGNIFLKESNNDVRYPSVKFHGSSSVDNSINYENNTEIGYGINSDFALWINLGQTKVNIVNSLFTRRIYTSDPTNKTINYSWFTNILDMNEPVDLDDFIIGFSPNNISHIHTGNPDIDPETFAPLWNTTTKSGLIDAGNP
ncbi:MAG: hypothetical protein FWG98_15400, partial [Candidatus Cloacimonetes bacterium]|nr:hypothetical protein [Candidatus Cloacimonadota bacterium]